MYIIEQDVPSSTAGERQAQHKAPKSWESLHQEIHDPRSCDPSSLLSSKSQSLPQTFRGTVFQATHYQHKKLSGPSWLTPRCSYYASLLLLDVLSTPCQGLYSPLDLWISAFVSGSSQLPWQLVGIYCGFKNNIVCGIYLNNSTFHTILFISFSINGDQINFEGLNFVNK